MRSIGRRAGAAVFWSVLVGLCVGVTGCLNTAGDYQPLLHPTPNYPGGMASMRAGPSTYGPYPRRSMPRGDEVVQLPEPMLAPDGGVRQASAQARAPRDGSVQQTSYRSRNGLAIVSGDTPPLKGPPLEDDEVAIAPGMGPQGVMAMPGHIAALPPGMNQPPGPLPREKVMSSHPPYRVAPPDILLIEAMRIVPKGPYRLEPLETLLVNVTNTLPNQPIAGNFMITPEGTIHLGPAYGTVRVGGLTLADAQQAIYRHLGSTLKNPAVSLTLTQFRGLQAIAGQHIVRQDGTVSLGMYGSVYVAGLTLGQIKCTIEKYLCAYLINPQVAVDVLAYNSQRFYVIIDGAGYGQQVIPMPITGNETVLDAVAMIRGLAPVSSKKRIWLARPSPAHLGCNMILPVDWEAIVMNGQTATNYQILPGDRVYIASNKLIAFNNYLTQVLAPVEQLLGVTLLGNFTVRSFRNNNNFNNGSNNGLVFVP